MAVPFDHIAQTYDSVFTRSAIGQLQRKHVWAYIEKVFPELTGLEMLELNAGYGDDALMFSDKGFNLIATDVSAETIKVSGQKAERYSMQGKISSQYLDLDSFNEMAFDKKFDLIFSNFGSINSINPVSLQKLFEKLPGLLNDKGRFIAVVMPKFCMWETVYYLMKCQFSKAFRRWTSEEVSIANGPTDPSIKTWFYKPLQIKRWAKQNFNVIRTKPVGLALPPCYLDSFFLRKKKLLIGLHKLEKRINGNSVYSGIADHFIIDLQLK
jgi:ubiquinone/menaquinone biosynthesis C-methylase UbiE